MTFEIFQGSLKGRVAHARTNTLKLYDAEAIRKSPYGMLHHLPLRASGCGDSPDTLFEFPIGSHKRPKEIVPPGAQIVLGLVPPLKAFQEHLIIGLFAILDYPL